MGRQFHDENQRIDLRRAYELITCPCTHCRATCASIDTVYACPKYNAWLDYTWEKRHERDQQGRDNRQIEGSAEKQNALSMLKGKGD